MLVSNFGVGIIYCFLNLLFYSIDNRNSEKLDQFTPLEINVYKQNRTKHALARILLLDTDMQACAS